MSVLVYAQSKDRKTLADKLVAYSEMPRQEAEDLASIAGPVPYTLNPKSRRSIALLLSCNQPIGSQKCQRCLDSQHRASP
jgi:hypothetical protein